MGLEKEEYKTLIPSSLAIQAQLIYAID